MGFPLSPAEHRAIELQIERDPELIVAAAVRVADIVITVPRPGRHGDCINRFHRLGVSGDDGPNDDYHCGFITSHGRYVDRREACKIALAAGQITSTHLPGLLFSEDLWNEPRHT